MSDPGLIEESEKVAAEVALGWTCGKCGALPGATCAHKDARRALIASFVAFNFEVEGGCFIPPNMFESETLP